MSQRKTRRGFIILWALIVLAVLILGYSISHSANQTPQITTNQETNSSLKREENTQQETNTRKNFPSAKNQKGAHTSGHETHENGEEGGDKGTEYWPPFFGLKLKITDSLLAIFTFLLVIVGAFQLKVFIFHLAAFQAQARILRITFKEMRRGTATAKLAIEAARDASASQAKQMQSSIEQAERAAMAMEDVAEAMTVSALTSKESVANQKAIIEKQESFARMQMRAYLTVIIGPEAIYQERDKGLKFQAKPVVVNTGHTPAREVTFRIKADVLPMVLPPNFAFPLPSEVRGGSAIGPHQTATLNGGVLDGFVSDQEVKDIMFFTGQRALYVWGIVNYVDVFNEKRETEFGQVIYWQADGKDSLKVAGLYTKQQSRTT